MSDMSGRVLWFTGLSGSGKSTLCAHLAIKLQELGQRVKVLDGDDLRQGLCADLGFSTEDRAENVRRAMHVAGILSSEGYVVLVALITPFQVLRDMVRAYLPEVMEIFVDAPLAVCEARDPKGLYKRARSGALQAFTGVNSPFEPPVLPDLVCLTSEETVEANILKILSKLRGASPAPSDERRRAIAVDFDGVIANYDGWGDEFSFGEPRLDVLNVLQLLREEGWKIIVHTTRGAAAIRPYLINANVPFDELNQNSDYDTGSHKPVATVYWDDRAVCYSGNAMRDLEIIRYFRTWSNRR